MLRDNMVTPIHLVLVHPEIPHNTEATGCVCVSLGCPLHLIRPLGFHLSEQYIKRAGLDYCEHSEMRFKIPMPGEHARSINLANAVSIAAYEAYRQISVTIK